MASVNGTKVNNAKMIDVQTLLQAGINPKTGLPVKMDTPCDLKANLKKLIRIQDEQDACQTFTWYNLPEGITGEELERLLYYRGNLCFFYFKPLDQFFFMPYALDGGIDFYGRFNFVHPVPIAEGVSPEEKEQTKALAQYLSTVKLKVIKDVITDPEALNPDFLESSCVILHDYNKQLSQTIIPRQQLQEGIIDIESDIIPYLRTALKTATGVIGMRVNDQSAESNVIMANQTTDRAALNGDRYIPIVSNIEMQALAEGSVGKAEEFLESLQAIDNLRLGFHGLQNGGLFQKKSHMLESEQAMNMGKANSALQDRLAQRQTFCNIVNSIVPIGIWCEPKEPAINIDMNGDGLVVDDKMDDGSMAVGSETMEVSGDAE